MQQDSCIGRESQCISARYLQLVKPFVVAPERVFRCVLFHVAGGFCGFHPAVPPKQPFLNKSLG